MKTLKRDWRIISTVTLLGLLAAGSASAKSLSCHIIDGSVKTGYTSAFAIECNQDIDLTQHYIQVQLPAGTHSYSRPWSGDIHARLSSQTTDNQQLKIRAGTAYSGKTQDFILSKGTQATINFNYDSPDKNLTKDNLNLQVLSAPALKGSIKFNTTQDSSHIPDDASIDLTPTSNNSEAKSYHFKWQQLKGQIQPIRIGQYQISAQYKDKHLSPDPSSVMIKNGQSQTIKMTYHQYPNQIILHLNQNKPQGINRPIKVTLTDTSDGSSSLVSVPWNGETTISNLKNDHVYQFSTNDVWGYNKHISFQFSPKKIETNKSQDQYNASIKTTSQEVLTYPVKLDVSGLPNEQNSQLTFASRGQILAQKTIDNGSDSVQLPRGRYRVKARNIIQDGKQYTVPNQTISVNSEGTNQLKVKFESQPAGDAVSNWPAYLAMGAISSAQTSSDSLDGKEVDAIFKYAGLGGDGDPGKVLLPAYTYKTIQTAKNISKTNHHRVKPVMVVYTAQMSGGTSYKDLYNKTNLTKHFINLMLISQELEHFKGNNPGSIVLNPDLMGMVQQQNLYQCNDNGDCHLKRPGDNRTIQVKQALSKAYWFVTQSRDWVFNLKDNKQLTIKNATPLEVLNRVERGDYQDQGINNGTDILDAFNQKAGQILDSNQNKTADNQKTVPQLPNTFKGWIQANNWIIHHMGPDVTFGWQENVWNTGSANWIHKDYSQQDIKQNISQPTLKLWHKLDVYNGQYKPDFLVFDKYERDPLGQIGYIRSGWAWNARDWDHYMTYVKQMSEGLKDNGDEPVMLWQIPGGHLQIQNDIDPRAGHGATGSDYFMGATSNLHTNLDNLRSDLAAIDLPNNNYHCQDSTCHFTNYLQLGPNDIRNYDWHQSHLKQAKKHHVFAILWGGGSTTSVGRYPTYDGGWLSQKVNQYQNAPEQL